MPLINATASGLAPGRLMPPERIWVTMPPSSVIEVTNLGDALLHVAVQADSTEFQFWSVGTQIVQQRESCEVLVPAALQAAPVVVLRCESETQFQVRRLA